MILVVLIFAFTSGRSCKYRAPRRGFSGDLKPEHSLPCRAVGGVQILFYYGWEAQNREFSFTPVLASAVTIVVSICWILSAKMYTIGDFKVYVAYAMAVTQVL